MFAAVVVFAFLVYFYSPMATPQTPATNQVNSQTSNKTSSQTSASPSTEPITHVQVGNTTIAVEVEATEAAREQGLSGRASLAPQSGMLFVFDQPGNYGFWMKDMNFALDMIYADPTGRIVTIITDATPASYHANPPQVFYPTSPAQFVLEVPAGFAAEHNIAVGAVLQFK